MCEVLDPGAKDSSGLLKILKQKFWPYLDSYIFFCRFASVHCILILPVFVFSGEVYLLSFD